MRRNSDEMLKWSLYTRFAGSDVQRQPNGKTEDSGEETPDSEATGAKSTDYERRHARSRNEESANS